MGSFLARLRRTTAVSGTALLVSSAPLAAAGDILVPPGSDIQVATGAAVDPAEDARRPLRIEGTVLLPDGGPARGAVVVSSAGGQAAVGEDGSFSLEIAVDPEALTVELTALDDGPQGPLLARVRLEDLQGSTRRAGTLFLAQSQGCLPDWIPTFGTLPGTGGSINALTVYDDGSGAGPALYAAGGFGSAGGLIASGIAKWDGKGWSALGSGIEGGSIQALAVYDDGSGAGPALYAGGSFHSADGQSANYIAKWDGQSWSALPSEINYNVRVLTVFDDGSGAGPALYAGGSFYWLGASGYQGANYIARWDGQSWSPLGNGMNDEVLALTVLDDGSGAGPALYAGGEFTKAGGQDANYIAKWDGQSWSPLSSGMNNSVKALTVFDDGSGAGPALYAGGFFSQAGGLTTNRIAKWDGQSWSALSGGMGCCQVYELTVFDDGSGAGSALYAGGSFTQAGGQSANYIAKWDGQSWSALSSGMSSGVNALAGFDDGSGAGPAL